MSRAPLFRRTRHPGLPRTGERRTLTDPLNSVLVKTDIPREIAFQLQERGNEYPGVHIEIQPVRTYPDSNLTAHLLGYLRCDLKRSLSRLRKARL